MDASCTVAVLSPVSHVMPCAAAPMGLAILLPSIRLFISTRCTLSICMLYLAWDVDYMDIDIMPYAVRCSVKPLPILTWHMEHPQSSP